MAQKLSIARKLRSELSYIIFPTISPMFFSFEVFDPELRLQVDPKGIWMKHIHLVT